MMKRRPYEDDSLNNMELFNEGIFSLILFIVPCYTDLMPNNRDKYDLGWILVAFLGVALFGALSNLLRVTLKKCRKEKAKKR